MESHGIVEYLIERFKLEVAPLQRRYMRQWVDLANKIDRLQNEVTIALVGKYTRLVDSYTSITKALEHAAHSVNYNVKIIFIEASNLEKQMENEDGVAYHEAWKQLCDCKGVIVPGGFGKRGIEGKIAANKYCRESKKPYLGICLGFQTSVIEFTRNVLNLSDAHTRECNPDTTDPVIIDMPEHNPGDMGGTMRLGTRTTIFTDCGANSKISKKCEQNRKRDHFYLCFNFFRAFICKF